MLTFCMYGVSLSQTADVRPPTPEQRIERMSENMRQTIDLDQHGAGLDTVKIGAWITGVGLSLATWAAILWLVGDILK